MSNKNKELIIVTDEINYGLVDLDGNRVLDYVASSIIQFDNDTYAIENKGFYQLYDSNLKLLNEMKLDRISYIGDDKYLVSVTKRRYHSYEGIITKKGEYIVEPRYDRINFFDKDDPIWCEAENKRGVKILFNHNGVAFLKLKGKRFSLVHYLGFGFLRKDHLSLRKLAKDSPSIQRCDSILAHVDDITTHVLDFEENVLDVSVLNGKISLFERNLFLVETINGYMLYDKDFKPLFEKDVLNVEKGSDGLIKISQDDDNINFYINKKGEKQFKREFKFCTKFSKGFAWVEELDGTKGIINTCGQLIIQSENKLEEGFGDSEYAIVNDKINYKIINRKGETITKLKYHYKNLTEFNCYIEGVYEEFSSKEELKDMSGEVLLSRIGLLPFSIIEGKYGYSIFNGEKTILLSKKGIKVY